LACGRAHRIIKRHNTEKCPRGEKRGSAFSAEIRLYSNPEGGMLISMKTRAPIAPSEQNLAAAAVHKT